MQDIQNAVAAAIQNITTSGVIQAEIEKQLENTIAGIIKDQLRQYSDFGKIIEAKVKEALVIDPDRISFPQYNDVILQVLQRQLDAYMGQQSEHGISEFMAQLLTAPPKEIKLTDLLKQYVEDVNDDHEFDGESFGLEIEDKDSGYKYLKFGKKSESRYSLSKEFEIGLTDDGQVFTMKINEKKLEHGLFMGPFYGFERSLFQMWLAKTKIVFDSGTDPDSYDTSFGGDY